MSKPAYGKWLLFTCCYSLFYVREVMINKQRVSNLCFDVDTPRTPLSRVRDVQRNNDCFNYLYFTSVEEFCIFKIGINKHRRSYIARQISPSSCEKNLAYDHHSVGSCRKVHSHHPARPAASPGFDSSNL